MEWIDISVKLPEPDRAVLIWCANCKQPYCVASINENGAWTDSATGQAIINPSHWVQLPDPPQEPGATTEEHGLQAEIIDGRVMLDIDEDQEKLAELMQHYINGKAARINDRDYYVIDMKNELVETQVMTSFYLKPVSE